MSWRLFYWITALLNLGLALGLAYTENWGPANFHLLLALFMVHQEANDK